MAFLSHGSFAQDNVVWPKFKGKDTFSGYLESMLNADERMMEFECAEFMVAASFVIDQNGHVDTVEVSTNESILLKLAITKAISTTHGQWEPMTINDQKVVSQPMVIIIYFHLESVCKRGEFPKNRVFKNIETLYNFKQDQYDGSLNTVFFDPIYVFGPRGFEDIADLPKQKSKN